MARDSEAAFLRRVLKDDPGAVAFCLTVARVSQTLDDLIDRDKPVTDDQIIATFWDALFTLPSNPFYQRHFGTLNPAMRSVLIEWLDATALERSGDDHGRNVAFALRDTMATLVIQVALLVGGYDWMRQVSVPIRRHAHDESLEQYKQELDQ